MSYIAKAIITILDVKTLDKIRLHLIALGYNSFYSGGNTQLAINKGLYALNAPDVDNFIDCNYHANENEDLAVKLFLELAQMDLNKPETLYYSVPNNLWGIQGQQVGGFIVKHCDIPKLHFTEQHYINKHNSIVRPEELAEAVQQSRIKLWQK